MIDKHTSMIIPPPTHQLIAYFQLIAKYFQITLVSQNINKSSSLFSQLFKQKTQVFSEKNDNITQMLVEGVLSFSYAWLHSLQMNIYIRIFDLAGLNNG
jgi:hypothetical protein